MLFPKREIVESLRLSFPKGTKVELVSMNDPYVIIPAGTHGVVTSVDDAGTIFVKWDTGNCLGAVYGVDSIKKV